MANGIFDSNVPNTPAVRATGTNGAEGVLASSDTAAGVIGLSNGAIGVFGNGVTTGVQGTSAGGIGGAFGGGIIGVQGGSTDGTGVVAQSINLLGLHAVGGGASLTPPNAPAAIFAEGGPNPGIVAFSDSSTGIEGNSGTATGVSGQSGSGAGIFAQSGSGFGVFAQSGSGIGIFSLAQGEAGGVFAVSNGGTGIFAAGRTLAGFFSGGVEVTGFLFKDGGGFQIDHPLDPANKYLFHSFVESPDMKNIYDGVVVLDAQGEAEVTLPSWFDALNTDFRYQLTAIGAAGPDLYIAEEISANRFKIAGGKPHMKVCWQVTGVRQDASAKAHPIPVEQDKPAQEHGYYRHPELYGESEQKSIARVRYPEPK